ncbi:uncharacterized protein LOC129232615 [Uloborus diversus]|uniref:uncharacterized protein LOC129232615 n=1 Tax=Uloborus diversus TaxID=327109 RepID=UPI00240A37B1|nr:uncharacterized protein LOC129232615 [Uloborus diversus]
MEMTQVVKDALMLCKELQRKIPNDCHNDDCEQYCLNYTHELSAICNRVSADASPMQKIIKNPKNKSHYKRSPAKKETVSSHQSNKINKPKPSPASDIIQIDDDSLSPVAKQPSTSFVEEYLHFLLNESTETTSNCNEKSSDISSVPITTETERDKLSGQRTNSPSSVTQVPSTSSIDACIESVVNEANEFTSKFSEKNSDIVNARKTTKKQRVKLSNKVSLAKKDVTRITSGSSTGIEKEKPSPTSSITKDSNSQDLFTSGSSTYYVEDYVHAFLTDTNEPSTSPNRMTFTISGKQRVIKNKKQKLDTQKSPEREVVPTTSSKLSAEKSIPTSLSPSSRIKKESAAQSPVKTQPSTSYGKSIVKLLEMFKADESPKRGVKRSMEEGN